MVTNHLPPFVAMSRESKPWVLVQQGFENARGALKLYVRQQEEQPLVGRVLTYIDSELWPKFEAWQSRPGHYLVRRLDAVYQDETSIWAAGVTMVEINAKEDIYGLYLSTQRDQQPLESVVAQVGVALAPFYYELECSGRSDVHEDWRYFVFPVAEVARRIALALPKDTAAYYQFVMEEGERRGGFQMDGGDLVLLREGELDLVFHYDDFTLESPLTAARNDRPWLTHDDGSLSIPLQKVTLHEEDKAGTGFRVPSVRFYVCHVNRELPIWRTQDQKRAQAIIASLERALKE